MLYNYRINTQAMITFFTNVLGFFSTWSASTNIPWGGSLTNDRSSVRSLFYVKTKNYNKFFLYNEDLILTMYNMEIGTYMT